MCLTEEKWPHMCSDLCWGDLEDKGTPLGANDTGTSCFKNAGTLQSWVGTEPCAQSLTNSWGISPYGGRMHHEDVYFRAWEWPDLRSQAMPYKTWRMVNSAHVSRKKALGRERHPPLWSLLTEGSWGRLKNMGGNPSLACLEYIYKLLWSWKCVDYWWFFKFCFLYCWQRKQSGNFPRPISFMFWEAKEWIKMKLKWLFQVEANM